MAQSSCERYLKYLVDDYDFADVYSHAKAHDEILHTSSLKDLLCYLNEHLPVTINGNLEHMLTSIDGFRITARYPVDGSIKACHLDVDTCYNALLSCKDFVDDSITKLEFIRLRAVVEKVLTLGFHLKVNDEQLHEILTLMPKSVT